MSGKPTQADWEDRAARFLKAELKRADVTYDQLAVRLKKHGFGDETKASIASKLTRGSFAASWFLAVLAALELEGVRLEDL
jgi:hypothetical protein